MPGTINKAWRWALMHGWLYRRAAAMQQRRVEEIRRRAPGEPVRVSFMAMSVSMWRYGHLYDLMRGDPRFAPTVVLSPSIAYDHEQQERDADDLRHHFDALGIKYVDCNLDRPNDIGVTIDPDVIFYPQPYECLLTPLHDCTAHYHRLLAYYPYAFWTSTGKWSYDFHFHNMAWRLYYSTRHHLKEAQRTAWNGGCNVRVVGYPNADDYLSPTHDERVWKLITDGRRRKRVVWAPHYSIVPEFGLVPRSQFLALARPMLDLVSSTADEVQWAFKPHPRLFTELCRHPEWGRARAEEYYRQWAAGATSQLDMGDFVDLFMTSDALVHDSGSFAVEYHYSLRPAMFTTTDIEPLLATQGEIGRAAYKLHYLGGGIDDVRKFIDRVVIAGHDDLLTWREWFFNEYLLPPGGKSVAQNTLDDLAYSLFVEPLE